MKEKELEAPKVNRPRLSVSDLPSGQAVGLLIMLMMVLFLAVAAGALGVMRVMGTDAFHMVDSETVWEAKQQETATQTYDEYRDAIEQDNRTTGVIALVVCPMLLVLGGILYFAGTSEYTKCPQGHCTRKEYLYCPQCGGNVYLQRELSPDEWQKRYGASGDAHI